MPNLVRIPARDQDGTFRAVVETPAGSPAKIRYDPENRIFVYSQPLALGVCLLVAAVSFAGAVAVAGSHGLTPHGVGFTV